MTEQAPRDVIRIATRKSPLALWQAEFVKHQLEQAHPGLSVELLGIKTRGDIILDTPLAKVGGKGLFVKELDSTKALVSRKAWFLEQIGFSKARFFGKPDS